MLGRMRQLPLPFCLASPRGVLMAEATSCRGSLSVRGVVSMFSTKEDSDPAGEFSLFLSAKPFASSSAVKHRWSSGSTHADEVGLAVLLKPSRRLLGRLSGLLGLSVLLLAENVAGLVRRLKDQLPPSLSFSESSPPCWWTTRPVNSMKQPLPSALGFPTPPMGTLRPRCFRRMPSEMFWRLSEALITCSLRSMRLPVLVSICTECVEKRRLIKG
mmetsp:Transcript_59966/g.165972  ORF Transcript_59966/g.165972 Transcript_59966/m.165972 type:complete len:215 (+) Transcript_59966:218-862(+)